MKKIVTLYSDGSSLGNPGAGGYGGILEYGGHTKEYSGADPYTTNNRMELLGVIKGLEMLKEPCEVTVVSDSTYVVKAINIWLQSWIKKEFKGIKNQDLWERYIAASKPHKINAVWVKGHDGHVQNERCDELAKEEALKVAKKEKGI